MPFRPAKSGGLYGHFFSPVTDISRCGKDTTSARHKSVHVMHESGKCFSDYLHLNANDTRYSSSSDPSNWNRPANPSREKPFKGNRQSNCMFCPNEVDIRPSDQLARLLRILTSTINVGRRSLRSFGSGIAWQELFPRTWILIQKNIIESSPFYHNLGFGHHFPIMMFQAIVFILNGWPTGTLYSRRVKPFPNKPLLDARRKEGPA